MLAILRKAEFYIYLGGFFFVSTVALGQPGNPGDPDVPIDGGIGFLLAAGALYGAKRIYDVRKNK